MTNYCIAVRCGDRHLESIPHAEASKAGYRPVTVHFAIRHGDQRELLLAAIRQAGDADILLTHNPSLSRLMLWRK